MFHQKVYIYMLKMGLKIHWFGTNNAWLAKTDPIFVWLHGSRFLDRSSSNLTEHCRGWRHLLQRLMSCDELDVPSGEHTKIYGKLPFIVDFPMKNGWIFHCYVSSPEGINCRKKQASQGFLAVSAESEQKVINCI